MTEGVFERAWPRWYSHVNPAERVASFFLDHVKVLGREAAGWGEPLVVLDLAGSWDHP